MKCFNALFLGLILASIGTSKAQFVYDTNTFGFSILQPIQFILTNNVSLNDGNLNFSILNAFSSDQAYSYNVFDGYPGNIPLLTDDNHYGDSSIGLEIAQLNIASQITVPSSVGIDARTLTLSTGPVDLPLSLSAGDVLTIQPISTYGLYDVSGGTGEFFGQYPPDNINSAVTVIMYDDYGHLLGTATVPEPSTYALFGLGALALVVAYRRKAT